MHKQGLKPSRPLNVVFIYSGDYGERVIRNLINDPSFCKSCGLYCDFCKYGVYCYVQSIRAAITLPDPSELPMLIDKPQKYLPKKIPYADLCVATGIHKDLLLALPSRLSQEGTSGLIAPIEDFREVPAGLHKQAEAEEECRTLNLECTFPEPFCDLAPMADKPLTSRFVHDFKVGRPLLEIVTGERGGVKIVEGVIVKRSAPCGSTCMLRGI